MRKIHFPIVIVHIGHVFKGVIIRNGEIPKVLSVLTFLWRFSSADDREIVGLIASVLQGKWEFLGNMLGAFLLEGAGLQKCSLLPRPSLGSAFKRLHFFMRWMIRRDEVDPGGWEWISLSVLIIPLDVHMFRAAGVLGFTRRKTASCAAAFEITEGFFIDGCGVRIVWSVSGSEIG